MQFNSAEFMLFLPVVVGLYYLLPARFRWILLLLASYLFYMWWKPAFAVLIAASTLLDWAVSLWMDKLDSRKKRLPLLIFSLASNLGMLMTFKYADFFIFSTNYLTGSDHGLLDLVLPVGISFYTFQTLSYTIDVYRGDSRAEKHLGHFALFVIYFPQLVAGPIERYHDLSPQLHLPHKLEYSNLSKGFRLILFGLFVKMVVADRLAPHVDAVYGDPSAYNGWSLVLAMLLYSFQIYGDFYGYSLVAMGSAKMMGVTLMLNFRTPYLAVSVADFWQRWHVSLSQWFRDYVFIPMGGSRVGFLRLAGNILIVFTVSGFWHGANWTFLAWGAGWGLIYVLEKALGKVWKAGEAKGRSFRHLVSAAVVFVVATMLWVPFRSMDLANFKLMAGGLMAFPAGCEAIEVEWVAWVGLAILVLSDLCLYDRRLEDWMDRWPWPARWMLYGILLYGIIVFPSTEEVIFIYFQF